MQIHLDGLPQLGSLHGLHNLKTMTDSLELGTCGSIFGGVKGLTSLAGLDSLAATKGLVLAANAGLTTLDGAPKLQQIGTLQAFDNPLLPPAAIDALLAQLDAPPQTKCVDDQCDCEEPPP